jgi:hypothetical protein
MSKAFTLEIPGDVANALRLPESEKIQRLHQELSRSFCSRDAHACSTE